MIFEMGNVIDGCGCADGRKDGESTAPAVAGTTKLIEDKPPAAFGVYRPGEWKILNDNTNVTKSWHRDSPVVRCMCSGDVVEVTEVRMVDGRIRGKLRSPQGWIGMAHPAHNINDVVPHIYQVSHRVGDAIICKGRQWDKDKRFPFARAEFGAQEMVTAPIVMVHPPLADSDLINAESIAGKVAVVARGGCLFIDKVRRCQDAGAVAVVIVNSNDELHVPVATDLAGNFVDASWVHIPVVCIKNSYHWLLDGEELTIQFSRSKEEGSRLYNVGQKVEVLGKEKPFFATIAEINADGSYSVRRLDGERKGEEEKWGANQLKPVRDY